VACHGTEGSQRETGTPPAVVRRVAGVADSKDSNRDTGEIPRPAFHPPLVVAAVAGDTNRDMAKELPLHWPAEEVEACTRDTDSHRHRDNEVAPIAIEGPVGDKSYPN